MPGLVETTTGLKAGSGLISQTEIGGAGLTLGPGGPADVFLLEDGSSVLLLEDGSYLLVEG